MRTIKKTDINNLYAIDKNLCTLNTVPGFKSYDEKTIKIKKDEYRFWNPKKSKLAAAILKQIKGIQIKKDDNILYLGAASGTTVSHISDIVTEGFIYSVEMSHTPLRDLILVAEKRRNIIPIHGDANKPEEYSNIVEKCDIVYQDIAQKEQTKIFLKNVLKYLKKEGIGMLCIKSRSIDVVKKPDEIYKIVEEELKKSVKIIDAKKLEPFEKDHMFFVIHKS
ncbi:MAG: fibrillarin-like rRNA/tRNA 2'-O-methyltransferase [Candidatus Nanoarchaeia archaeon]|nr:fibrillarin-like rRNA/tRNA 2'-O-methyltransferase [Candidatus Nanoarchaeia archaeon]